MRVCRESLLCVSAHPQRDRIEKLASKRERSNVITGAFRGVRLRRMFGLAANVEGLSRKAS